MTKHERLLAKIEKALFESKIKKKDIAELSDTTVVAISYQFNRLKQGKNIPIKTLFAIEEATGVKIFNI